MSTPKSLSRRWAVVLWLLLAGYAVFLACNFAPIAAGADSGGYLGSARLLAEGRLRGTLRVIPEWPLANAGPFTYVPLGFLDPDRTGQLTPSYPVGLPLQYALAGRLLGWTWGTTAVGVLAAVAALVGTFLCLRELDVGPPLALASTVAVAVSPMFLFTSLVPLSDTVATAWCVGAVLAALRTPRDRRMAVACGLAFSIAVLVRPTNVLLGPALAVLICGWGRRLLAVAGATPALAFDLWYNHAMYGSALTTGYGSAGELFKWAYVAPSLRNYAATFPWVLPLGIVALVGLPWLPWRRCRRELGALLLWVAAFVAVYAFYEYTPQYWWYLRFILPTFPAFAILGGCVVAGLVERGPELGRRMRTWAAVGVVLAGSLATAVTWGHRRHVLYFPREQEPHRLVPAWARTHLPPNAVVFCFHLSSAFQFYTAFPILRTDQFTPDEFRRFAAAVRTTHRPVYAAIFDFDQVAAFRDNIPGRWRKVTEIAGAGIWRLEPGD